MEMRQKKTKGTHTNMLMGPFLVVENLLYFTDTLQFQHRNCHNSCTDTGTELTSYQALF